MSVNNLAGHLQWLLTEKPFLPPPSLPYDAQSIHPNPIQSQGASIPRPAPLTGHSMPLLNAQRTLVDTDVRTSCPLPRSSTKAATPHRELKIQTHPVISPVKDIHADPASPPKPRLLPPPRPTTLTTQNDFELIDLTSESRAPRASEPSDEQIQDEFSRASSIFEDMHSVESLSQLEETDSEERDRETGNEAEYMDDTDDADMLEAANGANNEVVIPSTYTSTRRPALKETSGNACPAISPAQKQKVDNPARRELDSKPWGPEVSWLTSAQHIRSERSKFRSMRAIVHAILLTHHLQVRDVMFHRFKMRGFRPNQLEAINATLSGQDVFVLMPTGGGKSLCYQLPAIIKSAPTKGVTIVVSPLISLMEDQVTALAAKGINAVVCNSDTKTDKKREIYQNLRLARDPDLIELIYVTPELLGVSGVMTDVLGSLHARRRLARIVIDEAHCVSQWGHDFRPDYTQLGALRDKYQGESNSNHLTCSSMSMLLSGILKHKQPQGTHTSTRDCSLEHLG